MKINKFTIFLFAPVFVASAHAGIEDCGELGALPYLNKIAVAVAMKNNPPPIFIKNLLAVMEKNDPNALENVSKLFSCAVVSKDPTSSDSEGLSVIIFTRKDDKVSLNERVNQPAIQLWVVGGAAALSKKTHCYRIKYTLEKNKEWKESYLMADSYGSILPEQACK